MKRLLISTTVAAALAVPLAAPPSIAATTPRLLTAVTGPDMTIAVRRSGRAITRLRAGTYRITVSDRSAAHDFVLTGPGIRNKMISGLSFRGTRSATVTLRPGRYEYYCTPHRRLGMRGFLTVTR